MSTIKQKSVTERKKSKSIWARSFRRLLKNKWAIFGASFLIFMFLFSFAGPLLSPYGSDAMDVTLMKQPPDLLHWLGTDDYGRDVLTRLMTAGRISLTVGLASMVMSLVLGTLLGAIAGYYGGIIDSLIMRFADILMSIPSLPLLIIIAALLSEFKVPTDYRLYIVMIMISLVGWPSLARLIRGQILSLREQMYIKAADVLGLSSRRKIFHHLLPNTYPLLIVVATLQTAAGILSESTLSFLGLGVVAPTATWGNMITIANNLMDFQKRPWLWIPPGVAIFLTVIAINVLGDAIRNVLDPKMKGR